MTRHKNRLSASALIVRTLIGAGMVVMLIGVFYPLFWMVLSGFKDNTGLLTNPFGLPDKWRFSNYVSIWNNGIRRYFSIAW